MEDSSSDEKFGFAPPEQIGMPFLHHALWIIISITFMGVGDILATWHDSGFRQNEATILSKSSDWDYVEKRDSCSDDENCRHWTEIRCLANVEIYHILGETNHTSQIDDWVLYTERKSSNSEGKCNQFVENDPPYVNWNITIWYDTENPTQTYQEMPDSWYELIFLLGGTSLLFAILMGVLTIVFLTLRKLGIAS